MADVLIIEGNDNYGRPKQAYAERISRLSDPDFIKEADERIWLSDYANNNPRSDYHWQADACYDEARRRGKVYLYVQAHKQASGAE